MEPPVLWIFAVMLVAMTTAVPVKVEETPQTNQRVGRSAEMVMYGNHQNNPKVKKADPNVSPLGPEEMENAVSEQSMPTKEDELEQEKIIEDIFQKDEEEQKSRDAIEKMFAQSEDVKSPVASEDMMNGAVGEESSGEVEGADVQMPDEYYYNYNDYIYPELDSASIQEWLKSNSRQERSTDSRDKRSAIVAEDMMGGSKHGERRIKRDLTDDQIRELLGGGGYGGNEYYNYPSYDAAVEPTNDIEDTEAIVEDYPEDYREYLEEIMDRALIEADEAEREEDAEKLALEEAEQEYEEYLEEKEEEIEDREEVQKALALLRVMYENIPDDSEEGPVRGQREEIGPGYRVEEKWEQYLPSGASVEQESLLTDFKPIVYEGQEGIFIPLQEKRSNPWGSLTSMPGMKRKRGYVGFADGDNREAKRNYEAYGRLFRLARALRDNEY